MGYYPAGYAKGITNSKTVTEEGEYALDAYQNNPTKKGTLRNELESIYDARTKDYLYENAREIPFTPVELAMKRDNGDFSGLHIGDYKEITLGGEFAGKQIVAEIAGMDTYKGDSTDNKHSIDFVIRDVLCKHRMHSENNTVGGFEAMELYTYLQTTVYNSLPQEWKNVIVPKKVLLENKGAVKSTSWQWKPMKIWLLADIELFGYQVWSQKGYGSGNFKQYPLFRSERHLIKNSNGSIYGYWLLQPSENNTTNWCICRSEGNLTDSGIDNANIGVVFGFRI